MTEEPEVIVGEGQPLEDKAWYLIEKPDGVLSTFKAEVGRTCGIAHKGWRYIKLDLPTFPPRKPKLPSKPEQKPWRDKATGEIFWGCLGVNPRMVYTSIGNCVYELCDVEEVTDYTQE